MPSMPSSKRVVSSPHTVVDIIRHKSPLSGCTDEHTILAGFFNPPEPNVLSLLSCELVDIVHAGGFQPIRPVLSSVSVSAKEPGLINV